MRHQYRHWWQILILAAWTFVFCLFAYWIEGFEPKQAAQTPAPAPDALSRQPDEVGLWYLAKDIFIDGIHLNNFELEHPLYLLEGDSGQLFFALDGAWRKALGLETDVIRTEQTVLLRHTGSKDPSALATGRLTCNLADSSASVERGYRVILTDDIPAEAALSEEERQKEEAEAERVALWLQTFPWLEKLPGPLAESLGFSRKAIERHVMSSCASFLRQADGTVYLPFDWFTESSAFGWSVWVDERSGVYVSTDPQIEAQRYYCEENAAFTEALASYMRANNRQLGYAESLYFVYLFRHEAWVNGLDPLFLIAIARNESQFRKSVVGGGAIGLMQIMPNTGARFGYSTEALYDPHRNIQFGASYIARFLRSYDNPTIALSAYNAGPGKVASGDYSTVYAEHVLGHQQSIREWLRSSGCAEAFDSGPLEPAPAAETTAETENSHGI